MIDLSRALPTILPAAIAWAEQQAQWVLATGEPLSPQSMADARVVGVASPENVRVAVVPAVPLPNDPMLLAVVRDTGLLGPSTCGMALGHAILIVQGHKTRRWITHECRHVYQYEVAGSIAAFLPSYLQQIATYGYWDAPFEVDARLHEII